MIALSSVKQTTDESPRSYLTRFDVEVATVQKSNWSIILMVVVSWIVSKFDLKIALERDLPVDLADFYYKADRSLCQEDVEGNEGAKVNAIEDEIPFKVVYGNEKEKLKTDDGFGGSKRLKSELSFSSCIELTKTRK